MTDDIENFKYNLATIKIRNLIDNLENGISKEDLANIIKLLSPFCPHLAEELWEKAGGKGFVSLSSWPDCDKKRINEQFDKEDQAADAIVNDIINITNIIKQKQGKEAKKIFIYTLPNEAELYKRDEIQKRVQKDISIFKVNDKNKYDPQGKASKAKPGKPAIYVE